jgi:DNA-binding HxlR family transcriptional regulator
VIGGSWKVPILYHLSRRTRRFSELRADIGQVTPKVLTAQLRELERDGVITRRVYAQVPPRVEYSLTTMGRTLLPVVQIMCRWGAGRRTTGRS